MTLRIRAKVLLHVWSYDFYDMITATSYDKMSYCLMYLMSSGSPEEADIYESDFSLFIPYFFIPK